MRKEELAAYAASVRTKLQQVKRLKGELASMRSETVVLGRTEQILKSRAGSECCPVRATCKSRAPWIRAP
jgi:hypothetical protein